MARVAHGEVADPPAMTPGRRGRGSVRWGRWLLVFVAVVVVEVVIVGGWAYVQANGARDDLLEARRQARAGRAAVVDLDLPAAEDGFSTAVTRFATGRDRLSDPVLRWLAHAPVIGDDLTAVRSLAAAGVDVAEGALDLVTTVRDLPGGLDALAPGEGRLPTAAVAALEAPAARAVARLERAENLVAGIDPGGLVPDVAEAHADFAAELADAQRLVGVAHRVSAALPAFLGANEPRSYLLAAENPAEARGTGGFLGAYAVVELDDGAMSFGEFIPIQELADVHVDAVEPPNPDYADRYDRFGGAGFWQALNATPDFPSAATAIERLWERTEGASVDGVIAVDPIAYERLLELTGPVDVPGFGPVGADEVVDVVANEAYDAFDSEEQRKRILGAIAAGALQRALGGEGIAPQRAASTLLDIARAGHLKVHAVRAEEQQLLQEHGLAWALPAPAGDFLTVVSNSASFTKLDFYIDRSITYDVRLHADGSADATATVVFDNDAPTEGLPRRVIGPGLRGALEAGEQRSWVSVFCARGCEPVAGDEWEAGEELGHGVLSRFVTIASGESATMSAAWHVPRAWDPAGGAYTLTYQAQPLLRRAPLEVNVVAPDGFNLPEGGNWSGRPEGVTEITLPVRPTSAN